MTQDAEGHWRYSAIDWTELIRCLPATVHAIATGRGAAQGARRRRRVREAAAAYAEKRKARQPAQAAE